MRKLGYLFMAATLAITAPALTSCGDDDTENAEVTGITGSYVGSKLNVLFGTTTYEATNSNPTVTVTKNSDGTYKVVLDEVTIETSTLGTIDLKNITVPKAQAVESAGNAVIEGSMDAVTTTAQATVAGATVSLPLTFSGNMAGTITSAGKASLKLQLSESSTSVTAIASFEGTKK